MDRVLYREPTATEQVGFYPWYYASGPNRRSTKVMHNCWLYELEWLDDLVFSSDEEQRKHLASLPVLSGRVRMKEVSDVHGNRAFLALFC